MLLAVILMKMQQSLFLAPPRKLKGCPHQSLLREELFCIQYARKLLGNVLYFLLWDFQNLHDFWLLFERTDKVEWFVGIAVGDEGGMSQSICSSPLS